MYCSVLEIALNVYLKLLVYCSVLRVAPSVLCCTEGCSLCIVVY